jgi:hypothetical protein
MFIHASWPLGNLGGVILLGLSTRNIVPHDTIHLKIIFIATTFTKNLAVFTNVHTIYTNNIHYL